MIVLGIDSAELTGFAVVVRDPSGAERLERHGARSVRSATDVEATVAALASHNPDVVVIEEPFVHPRNPSTGLVLARLLGRWLQAFEVRGLTTITVPPSMWQQGILEGVGRTTRSADRKAAAATFVRERFGVRVTEDEADAIAMATWTARNTSEASRSRRNPNNKREETL